MKAWHCYFVDPSEGSVLVIAETRNKAKIKCMNSSLWDWEYIDISCVRAKAYDGISDVPKCIDSNDDLPEGIEPFYSECYL